MADEQVHYRVQYQIASYSNKLDIWADPNATHDDLVTIVEMRLTSMVGPLPIGHRSYKFEPVGD